MEEEDPVDCSTRGGGSGERKKNNNANNANKPVLLDGASVVADEQEDDFVAKQTEVYMASTRNDLVRLAAKRGHIMARNSKVDIVSWLVQADLAARNPVQVGVVSGVSASAPPIKRRHFVAYSGPEEDEQHEGDDLEEVDVIEVVDLEEQEQQQRQQQQEAMLLKQELLRVQAENEELKRKQAEMMEQQFREPVTPVKAAASAASPGRSFAPKSSPVAGGSRGAHLLKLITAQDGGSNLLTAPPPSPIKSPSTAFAISAVQTVAPVDRSSLLITGGSSATKRLFEGPARKAAPPLPPPLQPASRLPADAAQLMEEFKAVETILSLHRNKGTTPWWNAVTCAAASLLHRASLPLDLIRVVNGVLERCWPVSFQLHQNEENEQLPQHELLLEVPWKSGCERELEERRVLFERALLKALQIYGSVEHLPRAALPVRPTVSGSPVSLVRRLGMQGAVVSEQERQRLAETPVPAPLAHIDPATVLAVRVRQAEALLVADSKAEAVAASRLQQLARLVEQIRSCCRVNHRWHWPLDVFLSKMLDDPTKTTAKETLREMLGQLQQVAKPWISLTENAHVEGGTLVVVAKDVKREEVLQALEKLRIT